MQQKHDRLVHILDGGLLDRLAFVIDVPWSKVLERGERGAAELPGRAGPLVLAAREGVSSYSGVT
jgi:hypothetical protein